MARRKIDEYWRQRVCLLTENEPWLSARAMAERLIDEAKALNRDDSPSERWVRKEQAAFRERQPEARLPYRQFTWPGSIMGTPELPWEASAAALELLREHHQAKLPRPVIGLVKWFYRVSEAAPALAFRTRFEVASFLHGCEVAGATVAPISWRRAEARLATGEDEGPWFGEELGQRFMFTCTDTKGLSEVLLATNPMLTRWAADSIEEFIESKIQGESGQ